MSSVHLTPPVHGHNYYQVTDRRSYCLQAAHIGLAVLRQIGFGCTFIQRSFCPIVNDPSTEPKPSLDGYNLDTLPWKHSEESAGLCLFLHGLNASPRQWESYTRRFSRQFPETHYLAPYIVLAGNCPLEEAAGPVVQIVENYLQKFPGKPVTLVGTSNGARIALHVEAALNPDLVKANSRLLVISIAGVLGGTKLMDLAQRICCRRFLTHHGHIKRDFSFNNRHSVQRVSALQERQQLWEQNKVDADHYFFATTEDEQVRTLSSSLPYLPSTPAAHYQVVSGHTHETIVDGLHATFLELQAKND